MSAFFRRQVAVLLDQCEHCDAKVSRLWLVPGDVLNSCSACFAGATGREPVHELGHSTVRVASSAPRPRASFYVRVDGTRPT